MIRVFVAVDLPEDVERALGAAAQSLRDARIEGLRAVRPQGIHLTLKFLGDVPETRVDEIASAVSEAVAGRPQFEVSTGGPGAFPNSRRPQVLWVGIAGRVEPLMRLQTGVDAALGGLGFPGGDEAVPPPSDACQARPQDARQRETRVPGRTRIGRAPCRNAHRSALGVAGAEHPGARRGKICAAYNSVVSQGSQLVVYCAPYFAQVASEGHGGARCATIAGRGAADVILGTCCRCLILGDRVRPYITRRGCAATRAADSTSRYAMATFT